MRRVLIDVDTQVDFVDPSGALYVPADPQVPAEIARLLAEAESVGDPILGSVDSHAWDAWEFASNGGPFAQHCVKGRAGWLRTTPDVPARTRFVAMQLVETGVRYLAADRSEPEATRELDAAALAKEALGGVGIYFEKEVYSLFANPVAAPVLAAVVEALGGAEQVRFDVLGYCTGGYCVDAAVKGLLSRGYRVRVLANATAAIGGAKAQAQSCDVLRRAGAEWVERA